MMEDKAIRAKELDWLIYDAVDLDDLSRRVEAAFRANGPGVVPLVLDHETCHLPVHPSALASAKMGKYTAKTATATTAAIRTISIGSNNFVARRTSASTSSL